MYIWIDIMLRNCHAFCSFHFISTFTNLIFIFHFWGLHHKDMQIHWKNYHWFFVYYDSYSMLNNKLDAMFFHHVFFPFRKLSHFRLICLKFLSNPVLYRWKLKLITGNRCGSCVKMASIKRDHRMSCNGIWRIISICSRRLNENGREGERKKSKQQPNWYDWTSTHCTHAIFYFGLVCGKVLFLVFTYYLYFTQIFCVAYIP